MKCNPLIRTTKNTPTTPINSDFSGLSETFGKLKKIEKLLKKSNLLNNKYLYKRNDIYYFCIKINNQVVKKSLYTNDFLYSNVLKYKILKRLKGISMKYNFDTRGFYSLNTIGNSVILNAENDEKEKLLGEIEKTIKNKINRLKNSGYEVNHIESKNLSKLTLFECFKRFYRTQEHTQHKKYLTKFRQVSKLLFMFFGENRNIQTIEPKEVRDFLDFLLRMPKNVARIKELQGKNIKLLIEKNSPLLDKYEKVSPSSVDEHIKKCKTMFNYFLDCQYIYTNPFLKIKKQSTPRTQSHTNWLPFKATELKNLLKKTKIDTKYREEYAHSRDKCIISPN